MNELQQTQSWEIEPSVWDNLVTEVRRLNAELEQKGELTFEDLQFANELAKGIRDSGTEYYRALMAQSNKYKADLEQALEAIGYTPVANYIIKKDNERKQAIAKRMSDKISYFVSTVNGMLQNYPNLAASTLAPVFANTIMILFPKINSGAKDKVIKDWTPIFTEVQRIASEVESLYTQAPVVRLLPISSASVQEIARSIRAGFVPTFDVLQSKMLIDRYAIEQLSLRANYTTPESILQLLQETLQVDASAQDKLQRIRYLLSIL